MVIKLHYKWISAGLVIVFGLTILFILVKKQCI